MNIRIHLENFPLHIKGFTVKTFDEGEYYYCIFVNANLDPLTKCEVVRHELKHIEDNDFGSFLPADFLECERHAI